MSCQSHLSANDKGDNDMILVVVDRSPGICHAAEENPKKTSARKSSISSISQILKLSLLPPMRLWDLSIIQ